MVNGTRFALNMDLHTTVSVTKFIVFPLSRSKHMLNFFSNLDIALIVFMISKNKSLMPLFLSVLKFQLIICVKNKILLVSYIFKLLI